MSNLFFKNHGPILISNIIKILNVIVDINFKDQTINDIKDLISANSNDITFFHSKKYKDLAKQTKASFCLTTDVLKNELPKSCVPLIVENVLVSTSKITSIFYPDSINDEFDDTATFINNTKFKDSVIFGNNVLIGKNVSIGANCKIGHNTVIEKNVVVGNNCSIGSNNIIRNTLIKNNVKI